MELKDIQVNSKQDKKLKYGKTIIELKQYIGIKESILINDMVRSTYFDKLEDNNNKNDDNNNNSSDIYLYGMNIDIVYFIGVLKYCSNINVENIDNDKFYDLYIDIKNSIKEIIFNYNEVLDLIKFNLKNKIIENNIDKLNKDICYCISQNMDLLENNIPKPVEQLESYKTVINDVKGILDSDKLKGLLEKEVKDIIIDNNNKLEIKPTKKSKKINS